VGIAIYNELKKERLARANAKEFWYVSYRCDSRVDGQGPVGHTLVDKHPVDAVAEWCNVHDDGPYVLVFAMPITQAQYDKYEGHIG
jgi:hypothetical protein